MEKYKLYFIILGCNLPNRATEQHDVFFCIAHELKDAVPLIREYWLEAGYELHIDAWREVTVVGDYQIEISPKNQESKDGKNLFFINYGGYISGSFEEKHYQTLCVAKNLQEALEISKREPVIQTFHSLHKDNKAGLDIDNVQNLKELLSPQQKKIFSLSFTRRNNLIPDELHIGYIELHTLEN